MKIAGSNPAKDTNFVEQTTEGIQAGMLRICSICENKKSEKEFFKKGASKRPIYQCKKCYNKRIRDRKAFVTTQIHEYLYQHHCVDCGESDIVVLHFDHVRGKKSYDISTMINSAYSLKRIFEEIRKCDVVCANCHHRRTAKQQNWYDWHTKKDNYEHRASTRTQSNFKV